MHTGFKLDEQKAWVQEYEYGRTVIITVYIPCGE